jgi:hypothetical protein
MWAPTPDQCAWATLTCLAAARPFERPPLLVLLGAAVSGKSTVFQALAGRVPEVAFLDIDVFADDVAAVISPRHD